ncbi:hypothetical protein [Pedobacter sp. CFBP9032]|uniref:hypothetical protein n=1 Tax=Pedobacter sp. CFBP9032 TaxID=3096539 RepID=UPI002A69D809|nr:hypothetical protein [Pedobacter sp. CFBP9032]MDY0905610.1 hypothetical protein [Pedobacter sp. CFBP9032]
MSEIHPYAHYQTPVTNVTGGYVPKNTKVLIMGTFPPQAEYETKGGGFFYYSSERNHLWNRFDNIFENDHEFVPLKKTANRNHHETFIENMQRKMRFCNDKEIGFMDIFAKIDRNIPGGTADADLIPLIDVLQNKNLIYAIQTQSIKRICCVYKLAYIHLKANLINHGFQITTFPNTHSADNLMNVVEGHGKKFELVLLYAATRSPEPGHLKDFQYNHFIFN